MKRLIASFLSTVMMLSLFPLAALAEESAIDSEEMTQPAQEETMIQENFDLGSDEEQSENLQTVIPLYEEMAGGTEGALTYDRQSDGT